MKESIYTKDQGQPNHICHKRNVAPETVNTQYRFVTTHNNPFTEDYTDFISIICMLILYAC